MPERVPQIVYTDLRQTRSGSRLPPRRVVHPAMWRSTVRKDVFMMLPADTLEHAAGNSIQHDDTWLAVLRVRQVDSTLTEMWTGCFSGSYRWPDLLERQRVGRRRVERLALLMRCGSVGTEQIASPLPFDQLVSNIAPFLRWPSYETAAHTCAPSELVDTELRRVYGRRPPGVVACQRKSRQRVGERLNVGRHTQPARPSKPY